MGKFSFENRLDFSGIATTRRRHDKRAQLVGQRKISFISYGQNVRHLGGGNFVGDTFAACQVNSLGGNRLQAAAIVQLIVFGVPKDGVDIEKIVPQDLFDGGRTGAFGNVGMVFHAPEIHQNAVGANPALYAAKSVRRKTGIAELALNLLNGTRARNHDVDVGGLGFDSLDALEQQIAQEATHHEGVPFWRKESKHGAEVASGLGALKIAQGVREDVRGPKAAIRRLRGRLGFERHAFSLGLAVQFYSSILRNGV